MNYLEEQTRGLLLGCLREAGFSAGEAESRVESLESEKEIEYLIKYINEHRDATKDELRIVHTSIVRKHEARKIETTKQWTGLNDNKAQALGLLIREAKIDWAHQDLDLYLSKIAAFRNFSNMEFSKPITFFVGENGCGKSTMLEGIALAAGYNPEGGTRNYDFSTRDTHSSLHKAISLVKSPRKPAWGVFLRAESFYNMATEAEKIDEEDRKIAEELKGKYGDKFQSTYGDMFERYGGKSFHRQSHGESFYSLLEKDLADNGLYFFDEPEAALSPRRQLNLLGLLHQYAAKGAQFIIATHSPILLACPDASIYEFSEYGISEISYEETDIYRIVSGFVKDRDEMLKEVILNGKKY